ncbi:MAG: hypothetical protein IKK63_08135 [Clostridia bacterium]|nr:hypothetical protein [Clostridia bacterium]
MTAIFFKLVSAVMSVVVFLSGTFPGLFGGREYIYPDGGGVTITDKLVSRDSVIIKDYEAFEALGDIGVDYDAKYFEENALAIITLEYQNGDDFFIKSIYKEGTVYEIEYYEFNYILTAIYNPVYVTVIIETTKDTTLVHAYNPLRQSQLKLYEFLGILEY